MGGSGLAVGDIRVILTGRLPDHARFTDRAGIVSQTLIRRRRQSGTHGTTTLTAEPRRHRQPAGATSPCEALFDKPLFILFKKDEKKFAPFPRPPRPPPRPDPSPPIPAGAAWSKPSPPPRPTSLADHRPELPGLGRESPGVSPRGWGFARPRCERLLSKFVLPQHKCIRSRRRCIWPGDGLKSAC